MKLFKKKTYDEIVKIEVNWIIIYYLCLFLDDFPILSFILCFQRFFIFTNIFDQNVIINFQIYYSNDNCILNINFVELSSCFIQKFKHQ